MAATPPPEYTPPPADLPQRGDRATFSNRVDAWVTWFSTVILTQLAAMIANAYANALDAYSSATAALGYRDTANSAATAAQAARDTAQTYRDTAQTYRDQAAASAAAAANSALALTATSPTDNTIANGPMTFTTQAGKQFQVGVDMAAVDQANSANAVYGKVTSYTGTTLTINVTGFTGSGTVSDWNLSVVGQRGQQGATGGVVGGNLTGAINEAKGADIASTATLDIWSGAGNYEVVTGTATITGFSAAPQAGARRRLLAGGAFSLTASANMVIKGILSGQSFTCTAGDEIDVYAETTTKFRITITKGDGTAMAALFGAFQNTTLLTGTGTFTAKKTGWHRITLTGGGGRGGFAVGNTARATGASAAGFCVGMRFLIAGQSYNYAQGAAAADTSLTNAGGAVAGVNGSASTFFGSGIATMTANGGLGGLASINSTATLTGPSGGTATGGDINVQGGKAGDVSGTNSSGVAASGGGAVGVKGLAFASGDAAANGPVAAASGGAGIGGISGSATCVGADAASSGGGCEGGSASVTSTISTTAGINYAGVAGGAAQATLANFIAVLMNATAGGLTANATTSAGDRAGGGAGGMVGFAQSVDLAGTFAGGQGVAYRSDLNLTTISTRGGLYGGGGGGVALLTNSQTLTMRGGNAGLVQVEY